MSHCTTPGSENTAYRSCLINLYYWMRDRFIDTSNSLILYYSYYQLHPEGVQGKTGWGPGQPVLMGGSPAHGRGGWNWMGSKVHPNSNYSMILMFYDFMVPQIYNSMNLIHKGEVKPISLCLFIFERNLSPKTRNLLLYHGLSLDMIDLFLKDEHNKWFSYFNFLQELLWFSRYF